jgi:hypothetical protein
LANSTEHKKIRPWIFFNESVEKMSYYVRLDMKMNSATVVHLIYSLLIITITSTFAIPFSPTTSDYDGYGLKIAANNLWSVEAQNDITQF